MTSLLSSGDVVSMRTMVTNSLPGICTIQRKQVINQGGEEIETWADLAINVPCRIAPEGRGGSGGGGGETGITGGRIAEETTHILTLSATQDIEEADRVVKDGTTYLPTLVRKRDEWELSRRVEIKEAV